MSAWDIRRPAIREYAQAVERITGWPGWATFAEAVAKWESGGNPSAAAGTGPNAARGLFQIRPQTAANVLERPVSPNELFDPAFSHFVAAKLAAKLARRWDRLGAPDWLAIRRGWRYPTWVDDVEETEMDDYGGSAGVRNRFSAALKSIGVPDSFMSQRGPSGWPGDAAVLQALSLAPRSVPAPRQASAGAGAGIGIALLVGLGAFLWR